MHTLDGGIILHLSDWLVSQVRVHLSGSEAATVFLSAVAVQQLDGIPVISYDVFLDL